MGVYRRSRRARWGLDVVKLKAFLVDALSSALDLGIATPDDVLRHVTPDVLAAHLPRPLWARLLTACVGAPRIDAQLVVETIGVPNLCEHMPQTVIWACIAELGQRSLGGDVRAPAPHPFAKAVVAESAPPPSTPTPRPLSITSPPPVEVKPAPPAPAPVRGPSIPAPGAQPLADLVSELESEDRPATNPSRSRTSTSTRFRQTNTNIGRLAAQNRRPQAAVASPPVEPEYEKPTRPARRGETEVEVEVEIEPSGTREDWRSTLAVEDEQLVDWAASEETATSDVDDRYGRKR